MWYILWGTLQVLFQSNVSAMGFQGSACGACDGEAAHTSTFESAHTHMRVIYCNKVCVMQFLMGVRMHVWVCIGLAKTVCVQVYTTYDCVFGDFPAKNAVYTPHIYGSGQPYMHDKVGPHVHM
jgi:hypothetical protein